MAGINPGNVQAQALVNSLKASGMSNSEIARRVGRDASLISQIARKGNKGASLVGALQGIQGGAQAVNVPRRTTKAGTVAKTRRGVTTIPGTSHISVKTKRGNKTLINGLGQVSGQGKFVKWRLTVKWLQTTSDKRHTNTGIDGHLPSGWSSDTLAKRIANPAPGDNWKAGDTRSALKAIALSQNQSKYTSAGPVVDVHMYTVD